MIYYNRRFFWLLVSIFGLRVSGICFTRIYSNFGWFSLPWWTCKELNHLSWCMYSLSSAYV